MKQLLASVFDYMLATLWILLSAAVLIVFGAAIALAWAIGLAGDAIGFPRNRTGCDG